MKTRLKYIIGGMILAVALALGGFLVYAGDYYRCGPVAGAMIDDPDLIRFDNGDIYLEAGAGGSDKLIIFYPGGKVGYEAYLPMAKMIADQGIGVVVCKMPFNLAVFDKDRAQKYLDRFDSDTSIYLMGHSLGGAMASSFASEHQDDVAGLILLGSYLYGSYPVESQLTIYGSNDLVLNRSKIDYTSNVVVIDGGNHSGFGDYGPQKGDGVAEISSQQQQVLTVSAILEFIRG
ncbi:MAG: alpha/beta fold hydrolase [Erysipelotrichaceae bacterium]|nr:alpha/beta fold hydrolase [Erysipelotrichaceae bacterium]